MFQRRRRTASPQPGTKMRPLLESLEARQLLSIAQPMAQPLDVAVPLSGTLADGSSGPSAISPSQFRSAYGIDKIKLNGITGDGTGQTIAIIVSNDDPSLVSSSSSGFDTSDLHIFDQKLGLPDPPSFTKIEQNGSVSPDVNWAEEASLDVEWTHAAAPGAKIVLFEASDAGATELLNWGVKTAAAYSGVSVVSMSFGFGEFFGETSYDSDFTTPSGHNGVTFVASTGDGGVPGDYPAFSPNVVAVGGTHLTLSNGSYGSETGYASSGGGVSQYESKPSYQSGINLGSGRMIPDVSIDGDPNTGVDVYDSYNGGYANKWYEIAGTSFSAPAWAGLIAIADQGRASAKLATLNGATQTLPKLYSISSSDFHDITTGYNGDWAGPGYDLVTGRGSPIANVLEPDLAGVSATASTASPTGSITGEVYIDSNGNGKLDSGESAFSGVKIYIDANNNGKLDSGETSVTTGSNGIYTFSNLSAGTYHIREVIPSSWYKITSPSSGLYTITISSGQKVTGENWGNQKLAAGSISGYLYFDKNDNGKYDSGDSAMSGVKIYIDSNSNGKLDSGEYTTTTNSSGYFTLGNLAPGTYRISEVLPSGYKFSNPTSGFYTVTVTAGLAVKNENFGNIK